jgi:hypothetical protein
MYIDVVSVVTLKGSRSKQPDPASGCACQLQHGQALDKLYEQAVLLAFGRFDCMHRATWCTASRRPGAECSGVQGYTLKDLQFVVAFSEVSRSTLSTKKHGDTCYTGLQSQASPDPATMSICCEHLQQFAGRQLRHLVHAVCPSIYGQELVKVRHILSALQSDSSAPPVECLQGLLPAAR